MEAPITRSRRLSDSSPVTRINQTPGPAAKKAVIVQCSVANVVHFSNYTDNPRLRQPVFEAGARRTGAKFDSLGLLDTGCSICFMSTRSSKKMKKPDNSTGAWFVFKNSVQGTYGYFR